MLVAIVMKSGHSRLHRWHKARSKLSVKVICAGTKAKAWHAIAKRGAGHIAGFSDRHIDKEGISGWNDET